MTPCKFHELRQGTRGMWTAHCCCGWRSSGQYIASDVIGEWGDHYAKGVPSEVVVRFVLAPGKTGEDLNAALDEWSRPGWVGDWAIEADR